MTSCIILCGGEVRDYGAAAGKIPPGAFIICADSGYGHCCELNITPGLLVGDFDSIGKLPPGVPSLKLPCDKDYTDTAYAASEAVLRGYTELLFIGVGGGRADHTMANLQTMAGLSRGGIKASCTDGINDIFFFTAPAQGNHMVIPLRRDAYFSIFSYSEVCRGVTITGGRYPLDGYDLRFDDARAVSNEFTDTDAAVSLVEGTLVIVVTRD